ncbi:MAG: hypothetical protein GXO89_12995 [Chlorobi bacterium]|nr:hypothetical protein [Chlorobiota bacterium]
MEKVNFAEQKISLVQTILSIKDVGFVTPIEKYIKELIKTENEGAKGAEANFDAKLMTFNEWNNQFRDDCDLDDCIPEYGMTLHDFRLKTYNPERGIGGFKTRI